MLLFKHLVVFLTRATENSSLLATCLKVVLRAGDSSYIFGKLCENQYLTSANTHAGKGLELWAENDEERQRRSKTHTTSGLRPLKINKSPELMRQRSCRLVHCRRQKAMMMLIYDYINLFSISLRSFFKAAKMCNARFMKKHCTFEKSPPPDRFNPFCPNKMDRPDPKAGSSKIAITNGILTITSFAIYLLL